MTNGRSEFRALTLFDRLPPKHRTFFVRDDASGRHLRQGEYAVVDTGDCDPQHGENDGEKKPITSGVHI